MGLIDRKSILVVEDNVVVQTAIVAILEDYYEVHVVENGKDALMLMASLTPSLVLLDIAMPFMDGYETCRRIRETSTVPIIFVSSKDSLEERLRAFEVGGDDFVAKPFDGQILVRKIERTLMPHTRVDMISVEKSAMQQMALDLLSISGETRALLDFLNQNLACQHYDDLGNSLKCAIENYGMDCRIRLRHPEGVSMFSAGSGLSPLEESLLEKSNVETGVFAYKQRLLIASPSVSLLISNLPSESEDAIRIKNNLVALVEATESLLQTVIVRRNAALTTESLQVAALTAHEATRELQSEFHRQQADTQILLHGLIDKIENSYFSLGLTEGQEERISALLREETGTVMELFDKVGETVNSKLGSIMDSLAPPKQDCGDVWL